MRAFLGFCNFYARYLRMHSAYAAPMTALLNGNGEETKKGSKKPLVWTEEADQAFRSMKRGLLVYLALYLIDPDRCFYPSHGRLRPRRGSGIGAGSGRRDSHTGRLLEPGPGGRPAKGLDSEGERDLRHFLRSEEKGGPYRQPAGHGLHRLPEPPESAQLVPRHTLWTCGPARQVA